MDVFVIMTLRFLAEPPIQFTLNQAVTSNVSQCGSEIQTMIGSEKLKSSDRGLGAGRRRSISFKKQRVVSDSRNLQVRLQLKNPEDSNTVS
jgi:hypothetical protein